MKPLASAPSSTALAAEFADLVERLTARVKSGEAVDLDALAAEHPAHADDLRRIVPAMKLLADLSQSGHPAACGFAESADDEPLGNLGDFCLLREVGRGGMGVVYEAEQESLGRRVALKVLAPHGLRHPRQVLRFHREARATARLHHTNIVPVFGVGESEGQHYYVMQFIPGLGLDAVLEEIKRLRGLA